MDIQVDNAMNQPKPIRMTEMKEKATDVCALEKKDITLAHVFMRGKPK